jgi:hypothetical protein
VSGRGGARVIASGLGFSGIRERPDEVGHLVGELAGERRSNLGDAGSSTVSLLLERRARTNIRGCSTVKSDGFARRRANAPAT